MLTKPTNTSKFGMNIYSGHRTSKSGHVSNSLKDYVTFQKTTVSPNVGNVYEAHGVLYVPALINGWCMELLFLLHLSECYNVKRSASRSLLEALRSSCMSTGRIIALLVRHCSLAIYFYRIFSADKRLTLAVAVQSLQ